MLKKFVPYLFVISSLSYCSKSPVESAIPKQQDPQNDHSEIPLENSSQLSELQMNHGNLYKDLPLNTCGIADMKHGFQSPHLAGDQDEDVLSSFVSGKVLHPGASKFGQAFDFGPRQAAHLQPWLVQTSFPISSCTKEATQFFNQGMTQAFAYMVIESERSFRHAFMVDQNCIMALWGVALVQKIFLSGNDARASKIAKLVYQLKESQQYLLDDTEKELIDALYNLFHSKDQNRWFAFIEKLYLLAKETNHPDLKGLSIDFIWEYSAFNHLKISKEDLDVWVQEILELNPNHPIHHQRIHLWNDWVNENKLLTNAAAIGPSLRTSAHMWHMAAHVYYPLNRLADSDQAFEAAQRIDHKYSIENSEFPYIIHNYAHNANFWTMSLVDQGALKAAERVSLDLLSLPLHPLYNDPRNFLGIYFSPFTQGIYGYIDALFRKGQLTPIVDWYEKGILDEILQYPHLDQLAPIKLLAQLIISLKAEQYDLKDIHYLHKKLIDWRVSSQEELKAKDNNLEFVRKYDAYVRDPNVVRAKELSATGFIDPSFLGQLLHELKVYEEIIKGIAGSKLENYFDLLLILSDAYLNLGRFSEAKISFFKAQKLAMKMDVDHPLYDLGTRLNVLLNQSEENDDWRLSADLNDDFKFGDLRKLGPLSFPGLFNKSIAFNLNKGQNQALVVFVLGGKCLGCNEQLNKLYENRAYFPDSKIIIVTNDSNEALEDFQKKFPHYIDAGFEFLSSEDEKLFKKFRVYDDFEKTPIHGVFVLSTKKEIIWADRNSLPFVDWKWLSKEILRQRKVRIWKKQAISYEDFPKDKRR